MCGAPLGGEPLVPPSIGQSVDPALIAAGLRAAEESTDDAELVPPRLNALSLAEILPLAI